MGLQWNLEITTSLTGLSIGEELTDDDIDAIQIFNIKLKGLISRQLYNHIRVAFRHRIHIESPYILHKHIAQLAGIQETIYHCCPDSCAAFTGKYSELDACPICNEPRYHGEGRKRRPRQIWRYMSFTSRLQALYMNEHSSAEMRYRADFEPSPDDLRDVFDGDHYQDLLGRKVVVDGVEWSHKFFSGERDVALGLMLDGVQTFKRIRGGSQTCWPMGLLNFNWTSLVRTRLPNIIPLCNIPGPKAPRDFNSFLRPFIDEAKLMATKGLRTTDANGGERFTLRAYPISCHGDMPAIKHCQCFKGHNGICPCRACEIKAIRDTSKPRSPYYVPLMHPQTRGNQEITQWDPGNLPLRTDERIKRQIHAIESAPTKKAAQQEQTRWGINELSHLFEIPSISPTRSFPHEWMHLFLENHAKDLVAKWTGRYKDMDEGREKYVIAESVWQIIGKETAEAGKTIPSSFGRRTPNIATERHIFTAEDWGFWMTEIAPHVLKNRFPNEKFYKHFMKLNYILRQTLKFSITRDEVEDLRARIINYVEEYEK